MPQLQSLNEFHLLLLHVIFTLDIVCRWCSGVLLEATTMETTMARDSERRVFDLLPPDLQAGVRSHLAYGDSLFQFFREKLNLQPNGGADVKRTDAQHL